MFNLSLSLFLPPQDKSLLLPLETYSFPPLNNIPQRLDCLKYWCSILQTEGFDNESAITSLDKNRHLFKYQSSAIWTIWFYCNYIPREKLDLELVWIHYLFNSMYRLKDPTEAWVWLQLYLQAEGHIPKPLPKDINSLIKIGLLTKRRLVSNEDISSFMWGISDIPLALNSMKRKKIAYYITEAIASTWESKPRGFTFLLDSYFFSNHSKENFIY